MKNQVILFVLGGTVGLLISTPTLRAQACYNSAVSGAYGFNGSRAVMATATTGTGTGGAGTGSTSGATVSATPIGVLLGDMNGTTGFGAVGVLYFDGAGNVSATTPPGTNQATTPAMMTNQQTQVGTYSVNQDCTIIMTVSDVFAAMSATSSSGGRSTSTTPLSASFEGVVLGGGSEIDLAESGTTTGVNLELRKMVQTTGCTNARLAGTYGFMAQIFSGLPLTPPGTNGSAENPPATFPTVARFFADGNGNLSLDNFAQTSSLTNRQLTGTYTVNSDCTGTATFTSGSGVSETANFILVQSPAASRGLTGVCAASTVVSPEVLFQFTTTGVEGTATAMPLQ